MTSSWNGPDSLGPAYVVARRSNTAADATAERAVISEKACMSSETNVTTFRLSEWIKSVFKSTTYSRNDVEFRTGARKV